MYNWLFLVVIGILFPVTFNHYKEWKMGLYIKD